MKLIKLPKTIKVLAIWFTLMSAAKAQIIINSDIVDSGGGFAFLASSTGQQLASGTIAFFWFDSLSQTSTIQSWTKASDWTGSALFSNTLGSLSIGAGYGGAAGLFSGPIEIANLVSAAVGKAFAAAVTTSSGELGVFKFVDVLPANTPAPNPATPVAAILADVNLPGVLVGNFNANSSFVFGTDPLPGEMYSLIPEPSTASLLMIGAAGLVALRRLRKV
jgi:hypothetical protein